MGQLALGFRSLLIKAAVFVVLAALLAWALGGTLWPRPQVAQMQAVAFAGSQWHWQLAVGGARGAPSWVRWTMMRSDGNAAPTAVDERQWTEVAGPVVSEDGLFYAGRLAASDSSWLLVRIEDSGTNETIAMPDRLAVEQQLARIRVGLALQQPEVIEQQRDRVLDP